MSGERKYTERDMVEAKRAAFSAGWMRDASLDEALGFDHKHIARRANQTYPLPKVTRPRVWVEKPSGMAFKIVDGALWYTCSLAPSIVRWVRDDDRAATHEVTVERILAWADLLANPTEQVDE